MRVFVFWQVEVVPVADAVCDWGGRRLIADRRNHIPCSPVRLPAARRTRVSTYAGVRSTRAVLRAKHLPRWDGVRGNGKGKGGEVRHRLSKHTSGARALADERRVDLFASKERGFRGGCEDIESQATSVHQTQYRNQHTEVFFGCRWLGIGLRLGLGLGLRLGLGLGFNNQ